jgi:hypothetical protein
VVAVASWVTLHSARRADGAVAGPDFTVADLATKVIFEWRVIIASCHRSSP